VGGGGVAGQAEAAASEAAPGPRGGRRTRGPWRSPSYPQRSVTTQPQTHAGVCSGNKQFPAAKAVGRRIDAEKPADGATAAEAAHGRLNPARGADRRVRDGVTGAVLPLNGANLQIQNKETYEFDKRV